MKKISETLKKYQEENQYTYEQTAKALHTSKSNIYAYIKELRTPTMKSLEKLAQNLNISMSSLLEGNLICEKESHFLDTLRKYPNLYKKFLNDPEKECKKLENSLIKKNNEKQK